MRTGAAILFLVTFCFVEVALSNEESLRLKARGLSRLLADGGVLTEDDKQKLLSAHNTHRSATALGNTGSQPMATNMLEMVWDENLAISSKTHADLCVFQHSNGGYGENVYSAASSVDNVDNIDKLVSGVQEWFNEHEYYDYSGNDCADSKVCGHYTQVVWASSASVGCGYAECGPFPDTYYEVFLVCQYAPPGNYIGKIPYISTSNSADVASECPADYDSDSASGLCKVGSASTTSPASSTTEPPSASPTATSSLSIYIASVAVSIKEKKGKWKPTLKLFIENTNGGKVKDVMIAYQYTYNNKSKSKQCQTNKKGLCKIKMNNFGGNVDSVSVELDSVTAPEGNYNPELNFEEGECPVFSSNCKQYVIMKPE